jgi:hypothetical protein
MTSWMEYFAWRVFRVFRRLNLRRFLRLGTPTRMFMDYFRGFEEVEAVQRLFGERTREVLGNLSVEFIWFGYMGVDNTDGHLMVNERYFNSGNRVDIYLDIIHELVHVKQHMEGKDLFDPNYEYVDRPTEIEAYGYAVAEARRLGWTDEQICEYLKTDWLSEKDVKRLAKHIHVQC